MDYTRLPHSSLDVSKICLGTMTWGEQNTQAQAFEQLDYAIGQGINFIDTAEMYPVPPKAETQGETERILGNYLKARGKRDDLIIATKVAAPGGKSDYIRQRRRSAPALCGTYPPRARLLLLCRQPFALHQA